jgi:nucleotide-binding universal stress UspA family protein
MRTTIAVGVDGRAPGRAALRWALNHARATDADVLVIYVVGTDLASIGSRDDDEVERDAQRTVEGEAAFARGVAPDVDVTTRLMHGNPMRQLIAASKTVSMVVVGTHKTGFIRGRVFGSRSIVLAAGSRNPVVVIPESSGRHRRGVVVGVDDSLAGHAAVQFGAAEAVRTGEPLRLISAWRLPDADQEEFHRENDNRHAAEVRAMLAAEADRVRDEYPTLDVHCRIIRLPPAEALVDASASASVVVMGNSGPVSDGQGLLGSVAHDVLVNLAGPTVVVHASAY